MAAYSRSIQVPGKSAQELYDKVSSDIDRFIDKVPIGKFEIKRNPAAKEVSIQSSMVNATLSCSDGLMNLKAQLSLMASPFRGKLDEAIDKWLAKTFQG
jgi:hypothetical protein